LGPYERAEREAEYDNLGAVANSGALLDALFALSAVRRAESPDGLDRPYGPRERNKVDLFPGSDPAAPCLVFLHGG
jgi:arylformamidase